MERKHTPGPWVVQPHDATDKLFYAGPALIDYDDVDHDEQDANARLIAAAPELLEALENVELTLHGASQMLAAICENDYDRDRDEMRKRTQIALSETRAAIAKATAIDSAYTQSHIQPTEGRDHDQPQT